MSDQDFFFDEEPKDEKPAAPARKAPATASAPAPKAYTTPASKSSPAKAAAPAVSESHQGGADSTTMMAIAALVGVIGLLLGAILGFFLGNAIGKTSVAAPAAATQTQTGANTPAAGTAGALPEGAQMPNDQTHAGLSTSSTAETTATK